MLIAEQSVHADCDYLCYQKGIRHIYAYTGVANRPSQRLCERLAKPTFNNTVEIGLVEV